MLADPLEAQDSRMAQSEITQRLRGPEAPHGLKDSMGLKTFMLEARRLGDSEPVVRMQVVH